MKITAILSVLLSSAFIGFSYPTFDQFTDASANGGSLYSVGSPLGGTNTPNVGGQTNMNGDIWFGININTSPGANFVKIVNSNLTYNFPAGFPAQSGKAVALTNVNAPGAGLVIQKGSAGYTNSYVSFLLQVADASSLPSSTTTTGLPWVTAFNDANNNNTSQGNTPASLAAKLALRQGADNQHYQLAVANSTTTNFVFETSGGNPVTHSTNEVVFVVMQYVTNGSTLTVTGSCWVNPNPATFASATPPPPTMFVNGNGIAATPTLFRYLIGNAFTTSPKTTLIGEFRIGDSWAYVTGGASITNQPTSQNVNASSNVVLKAGATAAGTTVSYQWYKGATPLSNGGNVSGATTTALTLSGVTQGHDADSYTVVAKTPVNNSGITSSVAVVTVNDPYIAVQPPSQNVPTGQNATIGVTAYGTSLTYQWRANGSNLTDDGTHIVGAHTATLSLLNVTSADSASYSVVINNTLGGSVTSSDGVLVVQDPAVTSEPASATVNYGQTASFNISAGGAAPFTYQWQANGVNLAEGAPTGAGGSVTGTKTAALTLTGVSYTDQASYTCVVTNSHGNTVSAPAILTVKDPYIVTQPAATTGLVGTTTGLSVVASGSPTLTYQWSKGATALANGPTANGSTISGASTANLTITTAANADSGTYSVAVSDPSGQIMTSSNAVLTVVVPASVSSIYPASRTQRVGDHLAFVAIPSGTPPFSYTWSQNGTVIPGVTTSALNLANIQVGSAGTYSVTVSNAAGVSPSVSGTLNVSTDYLRLSSNNLVITRVGDGAQSLNNSTGNTLYLDQLGTDGSYVSTIMVPDSPTASFGRQSIAGVDVGQNVQLITLGSGADAYYEAFLTRSANQQYLNFTAYNVSLGLAANPVNAAADIRGVAAVNALGFYQLTYTNKGFYSGGSMFLRSVCSDDGLVDYWTTGGASSAGIKYAQVGVSSYATGNGLPALSGSFTNTRVVDIVGIGGPATNLVFSDAGDNSSTSSLGVNAFSGLPKPTSGSVSSALILQEGGSPNDFTASPDTFTVYVCDDRPYDGTQNGGGIQRWDGNGSSWSYSYTLAPLSGTNGASGITADFSANTSWGSGVNGAVLYVTTAGRTNSLVKIVDNGSGSTGSVLSTAGPNQMFRGVRFGPAVAPVQITSQPQGQTNFVGVPVTLSVAVAGDAPFSYQWQKNGANVSGATNSTLVLSNPQLSDSGSYTVTVSNAVPSTANSDVAVVSFVAVPPNVITPLQSRVETVGDHMAFVANVSGSAPLSYLWKKNGSPINNATDSVLALANIQVGDSGTYSVTITNANGQASSSATLTVTTAYQQLYATNIVVVRLSDGAQHLSGATGNTIYLDQFAPDGTYVNTIMLPDSLPNALIASGGVPEGLYESVLTRSQNGAYLNIGGFNVSQPFTASGNVGAGGVTIRGIGAIDAYGYFNLALTNSGLYNASTQFRSAVSSDGITQFWTTGVANTVSGLKYVHDGGATTAIATGGLAGTRVVDISPHGNLAFTDAGDSGLAGLDGLSGLPTQQSTTTLFADAGTNASPNDFAISPDVGTVYIADDGNYTGNPGSGGIQRWDLFGSSYVLSYTLPTPGSLGGARSLTVDYSASSAWGNGVTGAIIYATTTEASTNSIIRIVDNGPGSTGTVIATAGPNQLYRGMRFGPSSLPVVTILGSPQPQTAGVGGSASFTVSAAGGPFTYQWQLNGVNLTDGASPSGSGAIISGSTSSILTVSHLGTADSGGNYSVIVSNPNPSGAANSATAQLTVLFSQFGGGGTSPVVVNPDHTVQLNFSGSAGSNYRVWSSTNVALKPITSTWTLLSSGTFSGGADSFVDTNAPANKQQFYTITIP